MTADYHWGVNPQRTCIGCRAVAEKSKLVRVVAVDGSAVVDSEQRLPGRGAYLHADQACLALAVRRRAFVRALKTQVQTGAIEANPVWS